MTSSTSKMDRYTTTEYCKQNMFAHEPQIEVQDVNYWENAEQLNARLAMIGFFAAVVNYGFTGWIIPVMTMFLVVLIQTLHTLTHWRMQIDADAYCRNNAEWVEKNTNNDY